MGVLSLLSSVRRGSKIRMTKIVSEMESGKPVFFAWCSLPAKNFRKDPSFSASLVGK